MAEALEATAYGGVAFSRWLSFWRWLRLLEATAYALAVAEALEATAKKNLFQDS